MSKTCRVFKINSDDSIADQCEKAESFFVRLRGLIGRRELPSGGGMYFPQCNSIHMWFMSIPIDVAFLRRTKSASGSTEWVVSKIYHSIRPWRLFPAVDLRAADALELPAGTLERKHLKVGDQLCIE